LETGYVRSSPSTTANTLVDDPSVTTPSRTRIASKAPASTAICFASTLGSRLTVFRWQRLQRRSAVVIAEAPVRRSSTGGSKREVERKTVGGVPASGNRCVLGAAPRVTCTYTVASPSSRSLPRSSRSEISRKRATPVSSQSAMPRAPMPCRIRARCSSAVKSRPPIARTTSYTPSPKMKPRSSTETFASARGTKSPFRYTSIDRS